MPHPYETQRAGENDPLLLQDYHLIDLLSHFASFMPRAAAPAATLNTQIPSQSPRPPISSVTRGRNVRSSSRFSTVGSESGSHDLARGPRGLAVKLRTD